MELEEAFNLIDLGLRDYRNICESHKYGGMVANYKQAKISLDALEVVRAAVFVGQVVLKKQDKSNSRRNGSIEESSSSQLDMFAPWEV